MHRILLALLSLLLLAPGCRDDPTRVNPADDDDGAELLAALTADAELVQLGTSIRFDAGDSTDTSAVAARFSDTAIDGFVWDFGDGSAPVETTLFYVDHIYTTTGEFTARVTVTEGDLTASAELAVAVRHPPPSLIGPDLGADDVAVIGEWVGLDGRGFREDNLPDVTFEGVDAPNVAFIDEFRIEVQVPPTTRSGLADLVVDFPYEDDADGVFQVWVTRYGLATDAWRGRVPIIEFGQGDEAWPLTQSIELDEAAVVAMSGDGSFALVGDARFTATVEPHVVVVDMTADYQPVVVAELSGIGIGPLHGIAIAKDAPIAVVTDLGGFTVLDLTDPANPVQVGDRTVFQFSDLAPTAVVLNDDATKLALLSTFNDRVRFYELTVNGPVYSQDWVSTPEGAQDMVRDPVTGYLVVLGGGGEGAIPPDFDLGNTALAVYDWEGFEPENVHGPGTYMGTAAAPIPIDMAVGASGTAYVTTFDSNTGQVVNAFNAIGSNPGDLSAWVDLIDGITSLSVGAVQPLSGTMGGTLTEEEPLFAPFGFQGGVDVRFDERLVVTTVVGLGTTLEVFNGEDILYLSLDIDYGIAIGNLVTGNVTVYPLYSEPVVEYDDFVLNYDLAPVTDLLLPPWALGDVAIQP